MGSFYAIDPTFQVEQCQDTNEMWTLEFDGAHSSFGSGDGIVLTTPSKEPFISHIDLSMIVQTMLLNMNPFS
jgi:hypothetical protein